MQVGSQNRLKMAVSQNVCKGSGYDLLSRSSRGNHRRHKYARRDPIATRQLVALMIRRNGIERTDVASAIFTTTPDLDAEFPALRCAATRLARCATFVRPRDVYSGVAAAMYSRARALEHGAVAS